MYHGGERITRRASSSQKKRGGQMGTGRGTTFGR